MKRFIVTFFVILTISTTSYSQRVETLVKGPSTFDDGLALDSEGNIYAARYYGNTITKIDRSGNTSIFASGFGSPNAIAFDNEGNLLIPNATGSKVHRVSKNGDKEVIISGLFNPTGVAVDSVGNIFVSQYQLSKIVKLDTAGVLTTYLSGGLLNGPVGMVFDEIGNLFIGNFDDGKILKYSTDSTLTEIGDIPGWLGSFALVDSTIYGAAFQRNKIYKISINSGEQSVLAGTGVAGSKDGSLSEATFNAPNGIIGSHSGDTLYISDFETRSLRMITGLIPNNPKFRTQDSVSFGEVNLDVEVVNEKTLIIENVGNDTLWIKKFEFSDSTFKSSVQELKIAPYSLDSIAIVLTPISAGEINSSLKIYSNTTSEINSVILSAYVSNITSVNREEEVPGHIKLYQNYPNPFNPSTTISFEIRKRSFVTLTVYDITGREVSNLVSNEKNIGKYSIKFDASNLSSGVYFYKLKAGNDEITRQLTIIK
ncbi:MAG: T9SS type A sorting domain-containing protein [Balneolaceae bacterium]